MKRRDHAAAQAKREKRDRNRAEAANRASWAAPPTVGELREANAKVSAILLDGIISGHIKCGEELED